jgi:hypothetical protein
VQLAERRKPGNVVDQRDQRPRRRREAAQQRDPGREAVDRAPVQKLNVARGDSALRRSATDGFANSTLTLFTWPGNTSWNSVHSTVQVPCGTGAGSSW